jgi:aspartyl-tRNA(Asn)/glutamyl-tRNA(Gln) amidotransferase subunit A
MDGIVPLSWSLDSCGPMAAGASDVAVMWQAMTGAAPASPRLHGLRIGVPDLDEDFLGLDDEVGAAVDRGVKALEDEGGRIAPARLPAFACWGEALGILLAAEAAAAHIEAGWYERRAEYLPETRLALDFGAGLKATEVVLARRRLGRLRARWQEVMAELDVIVLPTTPIAAPRIDELEPHEDSGHRPPIARILTRICGPINFCDLAAVSVPCGFTDDELPIGMQLVAANEDMALSAALAFQESTDWHRRAPASVPQDAPSGAT